MQIYPQPPLLQVLRVSYSGMLTFSEITSSSQWLGGERAQFPEDTLL